MGARKSGRGHRNQHLHDVEQFFRLEGFRHKNHGAQFVPRLIELRSSARSEKYDRHILKPLIAFDHVAQVVAGNSFHHHVQDQKRRRQSRSIRRASSPLAAVFTTKSCRDRCDSIMRSTAGSSSTARITGKLRAAGFDFSRSLSMV